MRIDWTGFPETVALVLAGVIILAIAATRDTTSHACIRAPARALEYRAAPARIDEAALRDMLLHD